MGIAAGIAGGALISGYFGSQAANSQSSAYGNAAQTQADIYQQQRQDLMPYYNAGYGALAQIQANMPSYNKPFTQQDFLSNQDPGYQFRLQQGENAVNRAAAASGGAVGGSALQSLGNYAQGAASQEYGAAFGRYQSQIQNSYNRLASVAGLGQQSIGTGVQAGTAAGQGMANSIGNMGGAQAGGQLAIGNALNSGISQGIGAYQGNQLLSALGTNGPSAESYAGRISPGATGGLSNSAMGQLSAYQPGEPLAQPSNNNLVAGLE